MELQDEMNNAMSKRKPLRTRKKKDPASGEIEVK